MATGTSSGVLEEHVATGAPALDFTNWRFDDYDEYLIECVNLVPSGAAQVRLMLSTDGCLTFPGSYSSLHLYGALDGTTGVLNTGNPGPAIVLASGLDPDPQNGGLSAAVRLVDPANATIYKAVYGHGAYPLGGQAWRAAVIAGVYLWKPAVNGFRVTVDVGALASGLVRVSGLAKGAA